MLTPKEMEEFKNKLLTRRAQIEKSEMCEEPIGRARLEVKNFARFCIVCREINEKEEQ